MLCQFMVSDCSCVNVGIGQNQFPGSTGRQKCSLTIVASRDHDKKDE